MLDSLPENRPLGESNALPGFAVHTFVGAPLDCTTQLVKAMITDGGLACDPETVGRAFTTIYAAVDSCIPPLEG